MDDEAIRQFQRAGRRALLDECLRMIKIVASHTPLNGEFGDEYDQARSALHALMHRVAQEEVEDQLAKAR